MWVWDADMPQVGVGAAEDDVDIVTLDDSKITPVVPEPPRKSPKDKKKKKRKRAAHLDADGQLVIRLKKAGLHKQRRPRKTKEGRMKRPKFWNL
jgi:hypothetical protein